MNQQIATQVKTTPGASYQALNVWSPVFREGGHIPRRYSRQGVNVNPPIRIESLPSTTTCLAIVMEDQQAAPGAKVHWVTWNIPVKLFITENNREGQQGLNDYGAQGYTGPCPPFAKHRYIFKIYALDALLQLPSTTTKQQLEKKIAGHLVGFGTTTGIYKRYDKSFRSLL